MPIYVYVCDDCKLRQQQVAGMQDKHPETLPCVCGGKAHRDYNDEQGGASSQLGKELYCEHNPHDVGPGAEVHPEQIAETNTYIEQHGFQGVHCELTADGMAGRIVGTSRRGIKEYLESVGTFNKDGGYGDAQPQGGGPPEPEFITIEES